jgi:hypothetical protein
MLRITWNGIALHGGPLPGYAASHGCVRMPFGFAEKLFDKVRIGTRVIISPSDAEPVEFSHPALFTPNSQAIAAAPARAETLAREADEATKLAQQTKNAAALAVKEAAPLTAALRKLELAKTRADAALAVAGKALAAAKTTPSHSFVRRWVPPTISRWCSVPCESLLLSDDCEITKRRGVAHSVPCFEI